MKAIPINAQADLDKKFQEWLSSPGSLYPLPGKQLEPHETDEVTMDDITGQLERYGQIRSGPLRSALWALTQVNDDLCHGRDRETIMESIELARMHLDRLSEGEMDHHHENWVGET